LTPSGSVYARHDGGVGLKGVGIEVAGGLRGTFGILSVDAKGRILTYHAEKGYAERGAALTISFASRKSREGLAISLTPMWGNSPQNTGAFMIDSFESNGHRTSSDLWGFDAQASYGVNLSKDVQIKLNGGYNVTYKKPSAGIRISMHNKNTNSTGIFTQPTLR